MSTFYRLILVLVTLSLLVCGCQAANTPTPMAATSVPTLVPLTATALSSPTAPAPTSTLIPTPTFVSPAATVAPTLMALQPGVSAIAFYAASAGGNSSEIKIMPADGRNVQPIPNTSDAATLTWSPDGKRFAFIVHYGDSDWSMYVVNADGSNLQRLIQGQLDYNPRWSPDGSRIAFIRKGNLWVARISNDPKPVMSDLRQLTTDPKECIWSLDWSPDGTQIVFGAQMGTPHGESDYDDPFSAEIYVIRADGSNLRKLTSNKVIDFWPGWSPDGKQIVFSSNRDGDPRYTIKDAFSSKREGSFQIYVMNADGQNVRRLTNTTANDFSPAWSPDGKQIAFSSNRDGNFEIYVMNTDGSQPVRLTELPTFDLYPVWKPIR